MDIISLQSHVSTGYVGNAAAVPIIEALGQRVWPINTVTLAHHPGHGPVERHITDAAEIEQQISKVLQKTDVPILFHMGYLGHRAQGEVALSVLKDARKKGREIIFHLDPAFGDTREGVYVSQEIVTFHQEVSLKAADIFKANAFEASVLTGHEITGEPSAIKVAREISNAGPGTVIVTSVPKDNDLLSNILVSDDQMLCARVQKRSLLIKGTGDMFAAGYLSGLCASYAPEKVLGLASSLVELVAKDAAEHKLKEPNMDRLLTLLSPDLSLIFIESLVASSNS